MTARLTSAVLASGLLRRAEQGGGFGAVLAKGDPTAGAIMVILVERGVRTALLERLLQPDGLYAWQETGQGAADDEALRTLLDRRRKYDPDLWILELDVASAERFAAEMNDAG